MFKYNNEKNHDYKLFCQENQKNLFGNLGNINNFILLVFFQKSEINKQLLKKNC